MAKSGIIKTKRLIIEPFSPKYITDRYISWLNNPVIVKYSEQRYKKHTKASCQNYLRSFHGTTNYFWAISVIGSELGHIGNINAYVDKHNRIVDVGILIGETKAHGKGYATEAFKAVCNYLFKNLGLRKITAGTISSNKPMLRLMRRVGMVRDGKRKKHYLWEGKEVDVVYGAIFQENLK